MPYSTIMDDKLPFFGFKDSQVYNSVLQNSTVLFRLQYLRVASSTHHGLNSGPIVAPRYANISIVDLSSLPLTCQSTYAEVARHVNMSKNMEKRKSTDFQTPWVSTTFNFPYLVWEASRRIMYRFAKEQELSILMIDGRHPMVRDRAITTVDLFGHFGGDRSTEEWQFANTCQEVLIHGYVEADAVLCNLRWTELQVLIQEEYLQWNFLVITEVRAHEMSPFQSYSWHLAVELKKRYNQYERMKSAVLLATHLLSNKLVSLAEDPADVIDLLVAAVRAAGFWIDRSGGPYGGTRDSEIAGNGHALQVLRARAVDVAIKLPMFNRWSELVRLELRMEEIKQRYAAYKEMVRRGEPVDSRPKRLKDALHYFAEEMPQL